MNPSNIPQPTVTPEQLELFIQQSEARYMVALLILWGMVAICFGAISLALGWRKTGLVFLGVYGGLMSFLGVGLAYIFGPVVVLACVAGLVREWTLSGTKRAQPAAV